MVNYIKMSKWNVLCEEKLNLILTWKRKPRTCKIDSTKYPFLNKLIFWTSLFIPSNGKSLLLEKLEATKTLLNVWNDTDVTRMIIDLWRWLKSSKKVVTFNSAMHVNPSFFSIGNVDNVELHWTFLSQAPKSTTH